MTAGRNAVKWLRNGKKAYANLHGNKVRKACLRIPLVYSHRIQKLSMVSTDRARTSTDNDIIQADGNGHNGDKNSEIITHKNNENDGVSAGSDADKEKENSLVSSYYFPTTDSPLWLCIYKI